MALVLVVDDEQRVRQLLGEVIKNAGHEVLEADCSDAALKVMEQRVADVVFTDVQMPGHDGRWLAVELRKRYAATAVVLATAVSDVEPTITLRFGVVSYLLKPFEMPKVTAALKLAVDWHNETVAQGSQQVEGERLEQWLDSLELL